MNAKSVLLLNLAVLVANFGVALSASDVQTRVLRTTARAAYSQPVPALPAAPPGRTSAPADARLVKYLAKLRGLDQLTRAQLGEVCRCLDWCTTVFQRAALRIRAGRGAPYFDALMKRVREEIDERLAAAKVADERLRAELVRIVLSSTG